MIRAIFTVIKLGPFPLFLVTSFSCRSFPPACDHLQLPFYLGVRPWCGQNHMVYVPGCSVVG